MPTPRPKSWHGPHILSYAFRPFFFLGSFFASLSILLWLPVYYGALELQTHFMPSDWHSHELYFGYLSAVLTGFLFTAVPNWTGRLPIRGYPLLALVLLWVAGRFAVGFSELIGWTWAMVIDVAFLACIGMAIGREIIIGQNWKNLKIVIPVFILCFANGWFHLEAHFLGASEDSKRLAMAVFLILIMLIGGRIIPSFTRNWLARENPGQLPAPFNRFDAISLFCAAVCLASWVLAPQSNLTGALAIIAAITQMLRLSRWAGLRTLQEPLIVVLHISYAFIPIGFLLLAFSIYLSDLVSPLATLHAWGAGAAGGMTMSVMVRASFGHSGRALKATPVTIIIFFALIISILARILAAFSDDYALLLLHIAALGWIISFCGFALWHIPLFFGPRRNT